MHTDAGKCCCTALGQKWHHWAQNRNRFYMGCAEFNGIHTDPSEFVEFLLLHTCLTLMWILLTGHWKIHLPLWCVGISMHLIRDFISIKCQKWVLYLKATKEPWYNVAASRPFCSHPSSSSLLQNLSYLTVTFWQYFMAILESWSHLHLFPSGSLSISLSVSFPVSIL